MRFILISLLIVLLCNNVSAQFDILCRYPKRADKFLQCINDKTKADIAGPVTKCLKGTLAQKLPENCDAKKMLSDKGKECFNTYHVQGKKFDMGSAIPCMTILIIG